MKKYRVPFESRDDVWLKAYASIEANSEQEAFDKLKNHLKDSGNPYTVFDCDWEGVNSGVVSAVETIDYNCDDYVADDVKEDYNISTNDKYSAYDLAQNLIRKTSNLELNIKYLDPDLVSILEGIDGDMASEPCGELWKSYKIDTLKATIGDNSDNDFEDSFKDLWEEFINYCIQSNADYVILKRG